MRTSTKILVFALIIFGLMQFFTPTRNLEPDYRSLKAFETETAPQAAVAEVLKNTCYDCHSNHTKYPWYGSIAPLSFWLNHHIEEGKEHLNLSDWENWNIEKKDHKL
ncbi:MAG: heme-binding domain-containing protein, partial [Flavobacteriaceae bacterium]|nr:heme-binding domain-containing protein [Flavobacteriaceae bacterium]